MKFSIFFLIFFPSNDRYRVTTLPAKTMRIKTFIVILLQCRGAPRWAPVFNFSLMICESYWFMHTFTNSCIYLISMIMYWVIQNNYFNNVFCFRKLFFLLIVSSLRPISTLRRRTHAKHSHKETALQGSLKQAYYVFHLPAQKEPLRKTNCNKSTLCQKMSIASHLYCLTHTSILISIRLFLSVRSSQLYNHRLFRA